MLTHTYTHTHTHNCIETEVASPSLMFFVSRGLRNAVEVISSCLCSQATCPSSRGISICSDSLRAFENTGIPPQKSGKKRRKERGGVCVEFSFKEDVFQKSIALLTQVC